MLYIIVMAASQKMKAPPETLLNWTSALELGHSGIDEQHKRLMLQARALVEPLVNSSDHKFGAAQLQLLIDFAQEHFAFEEGLMRSTGYPAADQHAKYHASLLAELVKYCSKVQGNLHTNPAEFIDFLWTWLALQINTGDRDLVVWLNYHDANERG